jgi:hypothetical protein
MTTEPYAAQRQVITDKIEFVGRIAVLAVGLLLLSRNITGTFTGWREDNSAVYSVFARNHIYYGLGNTKLFNIWDETKTFPSQPNQYLNQPPLLAVIAVIPMFVFGDSEWVGRSVPIAMTLGSAWILMVIVSRLQSQVLGVVAGLFYVMLPVTAYFGRILCHESPVQFFSLLILHGYLQWAGLYGNGYNLKAGAMYYILGVVLGTGTGWAAVIMAGLIWPWHLWRMFYNHSSRWLLFWLTVIPALSLAAVVAHILWGCGWDLGWFVHLFLSRSGHEQQLLPGQWFSENCKFIIDNFSVFGVGAAMAWLGIVPAVLRYTQAGSPVQRIVCNKTFVVPVLLILLQGLIWVSLFRRQSWMHEYWQYFLAPFVAVAMASIVLAVFIMCSKRMPRLALAVAVLLIFLPVPSFARQLDAYYERSQISDAYNVYIYNMVAAMKKLNKYVPPHIPVMTSKSYELDQNIGGRTSYRMVSQAAYYANRPLIYTTDIDEIEANRRHCGAYLLEASADPNICRLTQKLSEKYKPVCIETFYVIFLLDPGQGGQIAPK